MSTTSLNPVELTTMVNDLVKDRTIFSTHQVLPSPNKLNSAASKRQGSPKKPALSLGAMAAELEEQEKLALRKKQ